MKTKFLNILMSGIVLISISSCKKNKPGIVNFKFQIENAGTPVTINTSTDYTLTNGTKYNATLLKFYINNIRLVNVDGSIQSAKNYTLLDFAQAKDQYVFNAVPPGKYKSIMFNLGVDSERNHSGAQDGDLDPSTGMIWTWSTGYIFFKHEGQFINSTSATQGLIYHYGTDKAYVSDITIPIAEFLKVGGNTTTATINLDLNKLYKGLDFNIDFNRQSGDAASVPWISTLSQNFRTSFGLKSVD
jgi:hypothetical protein